MDTSYYDIGRIPHRAAFASSIALYIVAVIAAVLRGFVRWHYNQLRLLDDGMVIFSVACMTVSFALWMSYIGRVYITEALIYDPFSYISSFGNIIQIAIDIQIFSTTYIVISVTGIFAIKFSFLFFFRHLIDRIHKLQVYWKCIAIYTAIVWVVSISIAPIACPFYDARAVSCAQGPYFHRALDVSIVLLVFDVTTDLLIISIPIILIRKIKIPLKSKVYLAMTLCLSFVMMVVAILQGATITNAGVDAVDVVWELYFQFIELTLAILVVSLTAFRTFFVGRRSKHSRPSTATPPHKKWSNNSAKRVWQKLSHKSGTTGTDETAWTNTDIPMSSGPLPSMIQPEQQDSGVRNLSEQRPSDRRTSERRASDRSKMSWGRQLSDRDAGLNSHPTMTTGDFGGTTLASHSDPEPFVAGTLDGPLMDMPMAFPIQTPPEDGPQLEVRPRRPRSQVSAERRVSYWQRMIRVGVERAAAVMPGRSASLSTRGRDTPNRDSDRASHERVSPIGPSPERSPTRAAF